jgi:hypothetical protein
LKAFCLAVVSCLSIVPAHAGEMGSGPRGAKIGETALSRAYRAAWLAEYSRHRQESALSSQIGAYGDSGVAAMLDAAGPARTAVEARIRAIAAEIDAEMREMAADGKPLRYRLRVQCAARYVALRGPAAAALVSAAASGSDVTEVSATVESCVVKVRWTRGAEDQPPQMRSYSVLIPPLDETSGPSR